MGHEGIALVKRDVLRLLELLRPHCKYWGPVASPDSIEAYRRTCFPHLHESLQELWRTANGLYVCDLIVYGVPSIPLDSSKRDTMAGVADPMDLLLPSVDPTRFVERGYVPIAPDRLGNYYVADTLHAQGVLMPILFANHEAEYEIDYLAASNLWTFLRFVIGFEIGELSPEIAERIPEALELMGPAPRPWPRDRDYVFRLDPWMSSVESEFSFD